MLRSLSSGEFTDCCRSAPPSAITSGVSLGSKLPSARASRRADVDFLLLTQSLARIGKTDADGRDVMAIESLSFFRGADDA